MALLRRIARPMLASMYVLGGADTFRHAKDRAQVAEPLVTKIADILPEKAPKDPVVLVRADAAVKVVAGTGLALGRFPRLSAFALAASTVPTTLAAHSFWQVKDPAARAQQRIHFFKNVSMLGGLLIAAADTAGRPSLGWRARRAAAGIGNRAQDAAAVASAKAHDAADGVKDLASR